MITETEIIIAYSSPEAKLKIGINQGLLSVFIFNALVGFHFSCSTNKVGWLSFPKSMNVMRNCYFFLNNF
jgi:hypothetical protein